MNFKWKFVQKNYDLINKLIPKLPIKNRKTEPYKQLKMFKSFVCGSISILPYQCDRSTKGNASIATKNSSEQVYYV